MKKKIAIVANSVVAGVLLVLWALVLFAGGLPRVYAWTTLKFFLPFVGIAALLVLVIVLIVFLIKHKKVTGLIPPAALALCAALPVLLLMQVVLVPYPASIDSEKPALVAQWPFKDEVKVGWGGDGVEGNQPHAVWASERWAYDIVSVNGSGGDLVRYDIFGKEVYAPVSGQVVAVEDGENDIEPGLEEFDSLEGNYVHILVDETNTYLLLAHLKKGSIAVKVGDRVNPGDLLGEVGNSGTSSEPHLHIHHQRQDPAKVVHPLLVEGLPLYFDLTKKPAMPTQGEIIK